MFKPKTPPTLLFCGVVAGHVLAAAAGGGGYPFPYCQVVDRALEPRSGVEWFFAASRRVEKGGTLGWAGTRAWTELYYLRTGRGDAAFSAAARMDIPTGDGLDLPDALLALALRARWDLRGYNGLTIRTEAEPGFYSASDTPGAGFDVPFAITAIRSVADRLSGFAGLRFQLRDERAVDPLLGLRYSPWDAVILDVGYPESRARWQISRYGGIALGVELDRRREFALDADDERERVRYRESRYYGAVSFALGDFWNLDLRAGLAAGRAIGFAEGADRGIRKMEGGMFMGVGVSGAF